LKPDGQSVAIFRGALELFLTLLALDLAADLPKDS
jgi:hypothetical protein